MSLSSLFQPQKLAVKKSEADHKTWKAVFHTLRFLIWEDSKGRIFKDALERGVLTQVAPAVRKEDGTYSRPEYDQSEIIALYREAWVTFAEEFDREYIQLKTDALLKVAKDYFGYDKEMLLELNAKRQAAYFER